ncbi:lantibiotic dehydratase [Streptomyces platensis]|uniref:lantibiotic dehydratase n=1 Tax=Streptomyces platensis TaxID=58346 RepID=UPI002E7FEE64|nr:lantibiotic dehydratase [Streptomyces platensis]WUB78295.1 lantibiotic dehydratase family protein [Streptomyces platensis]
MSFLGHRLSTESARTHTSARTTLAMAGTPVLYRDRARHLAEVSPDVDARTVCAMLDELIAHRFLLSSLHPTATELPLRHPHLADLLPPLPGRPTVTASWSIKGPTCSRYWIAPTR